MSTTADGLDAVLAELRLDQRKRERRPIDRPGDEGPHVGHRADVILVTVREDKACDLAAIRLKRRQIRDHQIHPEQLGFGEHDAGVDEKRSFAADDKEHVHAELADSSQWDDVDDRRSRAGTWCRHGRATLTSRSNTWTT